MGGQSGVTPGETKTMTPYVALAGQVVAVPVRASSVALDAAASLDGAALHDVMQGTTIASAVRARAASER